MLISPLSSKAKSKRPYSIILKVYFKSNNPEEQYNRERVLTLEIFLKPVLSDESLWCWVNCTQHHIYNFSGYYDEVLSPRTDSFQLYQLRRDSDNPNIKATYCKSTNCTRVTLKLQPELVSSFNLISPSLPIGLIFMITFSRSLKTTRHV